MNYKIYIIGILLVIASLVANVHNLVPKWNSITILILGFIIIVLERIETMGEAR